MNNFRKWGISKELAQKIIQRDTKCSYCGKIFTPNPNNKDKPTWEHVINDLKIITYQNIVLCCNSCNASKGNKKLRDWLKSAYCKLKNITENSVSDIVKGHLC